MQKVYDVAKLIIVYQIQFVQIFMTSFSNQKNLYVSLSNCLRNSFKKPIKAIVTASDDFT